MNKRKTRQGASQQDSVGLSKKGTKCTGTWGCDPCWFLVLSRAIKNRAVYFGLKVRQEEAPRRDKRRGGLRHPCGSLVVCNNVSDRRYTHCASLHTHCASLYTHLGLLCIQFTAGERRRGERDEGEGRERGGRKVGGGEGVEGGGRERGVGKRERESGVGRW